MPVVLWFNVGKFVRLAALNTGALLKIGTAEEPVKLPKTVLAATVTAVKVNTGAVVGFDPREAVKSGGRFPVVKLTNPGDRLEQVPSFRKKPTQEPPPNSVMISADAANLDVVGVRPKINPVPDEGNFAVVPAKVSMIVRSLLTTVPQFWEPWTGNVRPRFGVVWP